MLLNPYRFASPLPPADVGPTPYVVGVSTIASSNQQAPLPSGWAAGDLLMVMMNGGATGKVVSPGWTQVPVPTTEAGNNSIQVFWKFAASGETAVSTGSGSTRGVGALLAIRNVAPWPISVFSKALHDSVSRLLPSLIAPTANCRIIQGVSDGVDATGARASGWTNAFLSPVEIADTSTNWNSGGGLAVASGEALTPGDIGATSFTWANTAGGDAVSVAVNPTQSTITTPPAGTGVPLSGVNGSSTAVVPWSIAIPAGTSADDLAILAIGVNGANAGVPSTPSGWTLLASQDNTGLVRGYWYYRLIDGSEGSTVAGNLSAANQWGAKIFVLKSGSFVAGSVPEIAKGSAASQLETQPPALSPSWGSKWNWCVSSMFFRSAIIERTPFSTYLSGSYTNSRALGCVFPVFGSTPMLGHWRLANVSGGAVIATIMVRRT